jgi:hypothetical protein
MLSLVSINFFYFDLPSFYAIFLGVQRKTAPMQRMKHTCPIAALPDRDNRGSEWASSALFG